MNKDIYEIYRACRLCGVGAGYKMPIVQSIINVDNDEIELKQKIKDCIQIEVNLHDRMPPLICELCVDKIQDFHEFRKMCQETNKKTRIRLGLPYQIVQSTSEPDCILGVTESLISDVEESEPLIKRQARKPRPKSAQIKKESDVKVELENQAILIESRSPSPEAGRRETRRVTRLSKTDDSLFTELQDATTKPQPKAKPGPKSVVKKYRERQKEAEKETIDYQIEGNELLVPRQKRPREVVLEMPPVPKKTRLSLEAAKQETPCKPSPRSVKEFPKPTPPLKPPKAGPRSRKRETSPAIKSQKVEPAPGPKSKKSEYKDSTPKSRKSDFMASKSKPEVKSKREISPMPAAKSKKEESFSGPASKTKKRDTSSPGPLCKKRDLSPRACDRASPPPPKASTECNICGVKAKKPQGLASHIKTHVPSITPANMACNACELWFATNVAATAHHRRHASVPLPYTCQKCYDDFRTDKDYELHFTRNQCLATYEVPDVKCDECWRTYPTYKLLEDHRCQGEKGRPGGKCANCQRAIASQKGLIMHEMRCTVKRRVELVETPKVETPKVEKLKVWTPKVDSDSVHGLLPMRVRIVRCDALLPGRDCYDAKKFSPKFGLDRSCTYPYLTIGDVKPEPAATFDHMVAIKDEVKMEFLNDTNSGDDISHSNSDNESDDYLSTQNKSVASLSNISLKTLFSPTCLGKVPRKKRTDDSEKDLIGFDSSLCIDYHEDIRSSISNIIDNLAKESNNSDSYDSDSILDRNVGGNSSGNFTDFANGAHESIEMDKPDEQLNGTNNANNRLFNSADDSDNANLNRVDTNKQDNGNDQSIGNSQDEEINTTCKQSKTNLEATNDCQTIDEYIEPVSQKFCEDSKTTDNSDPTRTDDVSQNNGTNCRSSPKNGHIYNKNESLAIEDKVENRNAQTELENMNVHQIEQEPSCNNEDITKLVEASDVRINEQKIEKQPVFNNKEDIDNSRSSETSIQIDSNIDKDKLHKSDDKITESTDLSYVTNCEINDSADPFSTANDITNEKDELPYLTNDNVNEDDSLPPVSETNDNVKEDSLPPVSKANDNLNEEDSLPPVSMTNDNVNEEDTSPPVSINETNDIDGSSHLATDKPDANNSSYVKDDATMNSINTITCTQKDPTDTDLDAPNNDDSNENEETEQNLVDSKDSLITESELFDNINVKSVDKFNINYLDDEDKMFMAELDAQIGEDLPESSTSDGNKPRSELVGENKSEVYNDDVKKDCVVGISNEGFSEVKNDTLDLLVNKHNNLNSLELDNVSDEEYDFDI